MLDLDLALASPALPGDPRPGTRSLDQSVLGTLGIEIVEAGAARVVMRMPAVPGPGSSALLHVLAESLASTGAGIAAGPGRRAFGVQLESTHLAAPVGEPIVGIATPLLLDEDRQVWAIELRNRLGTSCLRGRCTLMIVADPGA